MKKPTFIRSKATYRPGVMNKTEAEYANLLEKSRLSGTIKLWMFEAVRLILAPKLTYTPDFLVVNADDEVEFHEVKGFWRDDAKAKTKIAAEKFPFIFKVARKVKKEWEIKDF